MEQTIFKRIRVNEEFSQVIIVPVQLVGEHCIYGSLYTVYVQQQGGGPLSLSCVSGLHLHDGAAPLLSFFTAELTCKYQEHSHVLVRSKKKKKSSHLSLYILHEEGLINNGLSV